MTGNDDSDKIKDILNTQFPTRDALITALQTLIQSRLTIKFNQAVPTNFTTGPVNFQAAQPDTNYMILAMPSWLTTMSVSSKTVNGFTATFGTPAPANSTIDYLIIR